MKVSSVRFKHSPGLTIRAETDAEKQMVSDFSAKFRYHLFMLEGGHDGEMSLFARRSAAGGEYACVLEKLNEVIAEIERMTKDGER